jgi:hypothetical protein
MRYFLEGIRNTGANLGLVVIFIILWIFAIFLLHELIYVNIIWSFFCMYKEYKAELSTAGTLLVAWLFGLFFPIANIYMNFSSWWNNVRSEV